MKPSPAKSGRAAVVAAAAAGAAATAAAAAVAAAAAAVAASAAAAVAAAAGTKPYPSHRSTNEATERWPRSFTERDPSFAVGNLSHPDNAASCFRMHRRDPLCAPQR